MSSIIDIAAPNTHPSIENDLLDFIKETVSNRINEISNSAVQTPCTNNPSNNTNSEETVKPIDTVKNGDTLAALFKTFV